MNSNYKEPRRQQSDEETRDKEDRTIKKFPESSYIIPDTPLQTPLERRREEEELEEVRERLQAKESPLERVLSHEPSAAPPQSITDLQQTGMTREMIPAFTKEGQKLYHFLYQAMHKAGETPLQSDDVVRLLTELEANIGERIAVLKSDSDTSVDAAYLNFLHRAFGEVRIVLAQAQERVVNPKYRGEWFLKEALFRLEAEGLIPESELKEEYLSHSDKVLESIQGSPYLDESVRNELAVAYRKGKLKALAWAAPLPTMIGSATGALGYLATIAGADAAASIVVVGMGGVATVISAITAKYVVYDSHKYPNLRDATINVLSKVREDLWQKWFPKEPKPVIKNVLDEKK